MSAAVEARKGGASCLILEADEKLGGATALTSGVFCAAGTEVQRAAGVVDTPDAMFEYIMTLNRGEIRPDLLRILCEKSNEGLEFLIEHGASFPVDYLVGKGRWRTPRGHACSRRGGSISEILARAVSHAGAEVRLGTRVDGLILENGAVVGARAGKDEYRANTVVVTTGGFANSKEMIARLYPSMAQHGHKVWAVHHPAPFILGDGITISEAVGARIAGFDTGLPLPTPGFARNVESVLPPWLVIVNAEGRRFMSETAAYSVSGYRINEQTGAHAFAIFDDQTLRNCSKDVDYLDPSKQGVSVSSWHEASIRAEVAKGVVKCADTISEVAVQAGIAPPALEQTVADYNDDCDRGDDSRFLKNTGLSPIRVSPFYAVEIRSSLIGLTAAGLDIDRKCRVLDEHGRVIPGLYAAGEVLGCIMGSRYAAGGISIANAIVFGRLAGQMAAAEAPNRRDTDLPPVFFP
jgi:succinate dehydrogenase/fumarate reductase flavoprotein subunit